MNNILSLLPPELRRPLEEASGHLDALTRQALPQIQPFQQALGGLSAIARNLPEMQTISNTLATVQQFQTLTDNMVHDDNKLAQQIGLGTQNMKQWYIRSVQQRLTAMSTDTQTVLAHVPQAGVGAVADFKSTMQQSVQTLPQMLDNFRNLPGHLHSIVSDGVASLQGLQNMPRRLQSLQQWTSERAVLGPLDALAQVQARAAGNMHALTTSFVDMNGFLRHLPKRIEQCFDWPAPLNLVQPFCQPLCASTPEVSAPRELRAKLEDVFEMVDMDRVIASFTQVDREINTINILPARNTIQSYLAQTNNLLNTLIQVSDAAGAVARAGGNVQAAGNMLQQASHAWNTLSSGGSLF
eukprot:m.118299 g.118299  ORF g.118299 m.118299 type:complete len:354 (+) comp19503_c0_seq1:899-1960(+)